MSVASRKNLQTFHQRGVSSIGVDLLTANGKEMLLLTQDDDLITLNPDTLHEFIDDLVRLERFLQPPSPRHYAHNIPERYFK